MRIYHIRRKGSHDKPRTCVAADDIHAAAMIGATPAQCEITDVTRETLARIDTPLVTLPVVRFDAFVGAHTGSASRSPETQRAVRPEDGQARTPAPPGCRCCERAGEYNGEGSKAPAFTCPVACICHD